MKFMIQIIFLSLFALIAASPSFADSQLELSEKVREKKYNGSFDEDELKVQKNFIHPRQKNKAEEADEGF